MIRFIITIYLINATDSGMESFTVFCFSQVPMLRPTIYDRISLLDSVASLFLFLFFFLFVTSGRRNGSLIEELGRFRRRSDDHHSIYDCRCAVESDRSLMPFSLCVVDDRLYHDERIFREDDRGHHETTQVSIPKDVRVSPRCLSTVVDCLMSLDPTADGWLCFFCVCVCVPLCSWPAPSSARAAPASAKSAAIPAPA